MFKKFVDRYRKVLTGFAAIACAYSLWGLHNTATAGGYVYVLQDDLSNTINPDLAMSDWSSMPSDSEATESETGEFEEGEATAQFPDEAPEFGDETEPGDDADKSSKPDKGVKSNDGHGNNGHGNNVDGVDSSNPGKSKQGQDSDPSVDDEKKQK